jgi:hypothetical protein
LKDWTHIFTLYRDQIPLFVDLIIAHFSKNMIFYAKMKWECKPSEKWLGNYSSIEKVRKSGLWLTQHLDADEINNDVVEEIIRRTKE